MRHIFLHKSQRAPYRQYLIRISDKPVSLRAENASVKCIITDESCEHWSTLQKIHITSFKPCNETIRLYRAIERAPLGESPVWTVKIWVWRFQKTISIVRSSQKKRRNFVSHCVNQQYFTLRIYPVVCWNENHAFVMYLRIAFPNNLDEINRRITDPTLLWYPTAQKVRGELSRHPSWLRTFMASITTSGCESKSFCDILTKRTWFREKGNPLRSQQSGKDRECVKSTKSRQKCK